MSCPGFHVESPVHFLQTLGGNALVQKALLEMIGVCAKITGRNFATSGCTLRIVLMPVLERLGDPCPLVQSAAEVTVQVVSSSFHFTEVFHSCLPLVYAYSLSFRNPCTLFQWSSKDFVRCFQTPSVT